MEKEMNIYEIRCPANRKHIIAGVEYDSCGTLLGGLQENSSAYFRCPTCGFTLAESQGEDLTLTYKGKGNMKYDFKKTVRVVNYE